MIEDLIFTNVKLCLIWYHWKKKIFVCPSFSLFILSIIPNISLAQYVLNQMVMQVVRLFCLFSGNLKPNIGGWDKWSLSTCSASTVSWSLLFFSCGAADWIFPPHYSTRRAIMWPGSLHGRRVAAQTRCVHPIPLLARCFHLLPARQHRTKWVF